MKCGYVIELAGVAMVLCATAGRAQLGIIPNAPLGSTLRPIEKLDWHIFGRVTTLDGEPADNAMVRVDIGAGFGSVKTVQTDLQGRYRTDFNLDAQSYQSLVVTVTASKPGYDDARETVNFGSGGKTWAINLVLRSQAQEPDQLSERDFISSLLPRLLKTATASVPNSARRDFNRGIQEWIERHNAVRAVPFLARVVKRADPSAEAHELLALALLDEGSWDSATRELAAAAQLNDSRTPAARRPEPLLALGVLESWKGEQKKAAGFLLRALEIAPADPLVTEELGRVELLDRNWEAADEYLRRAIAQGANREARLLRVRAVLEEGDTAEAQNEMQKYLGGRPVRAMPLAVRMLYSELEDRLQLEGYSKVKSVVAQPVTELVHAMPELKDLRPAADQSALPALLQQLGANVAALFANFPNTISVEQIRQERLRSNGKIQDQLAQQCQYLLVTRPAEAGLGLEEYRGDATGARVAIQGLDNGFMLTSGFASSALIFHPDYQPGSSFRYLGTQSAGGRETEVVAFAQKPARARTVERFNADGQSALILVQGVAWIDAATHQIVRMRTDLLKPQSQLRLGRQTTDIEFGPVRFKEIAKEVWLPRRVTVTVEWKGKNYRNQHEYSDFRLFNVNTREKQSAAALPPQPVPCSACG